MRYLLNIILFSLAFSSFAQNGSISGQLTSTDGSTPLAFNSIQLKPLDASVQTDNAGRFIFNNLEAGDYIVVYGTDEQEQIQVTLAANEQKDLGILHSVAPNSRIVTDNIFSDIDVVEAADENSAISGMLSASNDVFLNKAGYQFGSDVYFKVRGYDSQYSDFMINGVRMENPETRWQPFALVGGLNDVLRYNDIRTVGLEKLDNGLGEVGGAVNYNLRPSNVGRGGRLTYSNLNRDYNNRLMATYASGDKGGLSYVLSGSRRWAQEGYVEGTYYDAWAGYAAVEGKVTPKYSVVATYFASPRRRGTQSIHRQEAYDIYGSNYYNADWGWQDGQKRNQRLRKNYNPVMMFSNYLDLGEKTNLQITGSYAFGFNSNSRIERQNAANPDPDYYPEFQNGTFKIEPHISWVDLYRANLDGSDDNDLYPGLRANYILEDNVRDDKEFQATLLGKTKLNDRINLTYGSNYKKYNGRYFKQINDLLGADYWLNVDSFNGNLNYNAAEIDTRKYQYDIWGYDYDLNNRSYDTYIQGDFTYDQFDFYLGGSIGSTSYWRHGNIATGSFETNSLGDGDQKDFLTYGGKAGFTYKLDGRNYFSANGTYYTKPPLMNNVFLTPRTRDGFNPFISKETIYGGEVNYNHKSPSLTLRTTGYITRFNDQAESVLTFFDAGLQSGFGTFFISGIDKLHYGGELGAEYKVNPDISISTAAAIGKYTYMSRPLVTGFEDATENPIFNTESSFLLNFYEDNTPQTAMNLGLTWRAPKRFIINVDGNYYADSYASPSALRRTNNIASQLIQVEGLDDQQSLEYWTKQEALPEAFRLNLSLYKSFYISYEKQIGVNVSVNNLLDDQEYPTLAFEDFRVGSDGNSSKINPNLFPTRYRYAYGRTYFINVNYKFR